MDVDKTTRHLLYLMRCALQNKIPEPIPKLDYDALYRLSRFHSVVAMVAMAMESGGLLSETYTSIECIKQWKEAKGKAVRKNILLDAEREEIFRFFDKEGIWHLPLKGAILKDMYPKMGMRQMADNDILFDCAYQSQVKNFMESRGYEVISFAQGNHDAYHKQPIYNFELHTSLFDEKFHVKKWSEYYQDIKQRLIRNAEDSWCYHFTDEDFYVYFLLHGYKHYSGGGTGIRFLSDIFVFLSKKNETLNWSYVEKELKVLEIYDFETKIRKLALKLFGDKAYSLMGEEQELLDYLIGAGTYGTINNYVEKSLKKLQGTEGPITVWTKVRYTLNRLFPNVAHMKQYSTFCRKHPWSIPFFWMYRLYKAVTVRKKDIIQEMKALK